MQPRHTDLDDMPSRPRLGSGTADLRCGLAALGVPGRELGPDRSFEWTVVVVRQSISRTSDGAD
jgi:hypothetical protein